MEPVEIVNYRDFTILVFYDDYNQEYFIILDGERIGLGRLNLDYKKIIQYLVDDKLDLIKDFGSGSKLSWFTNGVFGNRDIKLTYKTRIIHIWNIKEGETVCLANIVAQASAKLSRLSKQAPDGTKSR